MPSSNRVFHLTWHKAGSQWVRDVLTDPAVVAYSGRPWSRITEVYPTYKGSQFPDHQFSGPLYCASLTDWCALRRQGDRALVVHRDPRDMGISLLYSLLYSHKEQDIAASTRTLLLNVGPRCQLVILMLLQHPELVSMVSWYQDRPPDDVLLVRYEDLAHGEVQEFSRIVRWLGWPVPDQTLREAVHRHSFQVRSGRPTGEVDAASHHRRGIPGDWKNHFDRSLGQLWEQTEPGVLQQLGYERGNDWWQALPEPVPASDATGTSDHPDLTQLQQSISLLRQRIVLLEQEVETKEVVIRDLKGACDERLALIQRLDAELARAR